VCLLREREEKNGRGPSGPGECRIILPVIFADKRGRAGVVDNLITIIISLFFISAPAPLSRAGAADKARPGETRKMRIAPVFVDLSGAREGARERAGAAFLHNKRRSAIHISD
jgi:hypothetical protein